MHDKYHFSFIFNNKTMSGVLSKLESQANAFNELGYHMVIFNREVELIRGNLQFVKIPLSCSSNEFLIRSFKYFFILRFLYRKKVTRLIVRYSLCDFSILFLVFRYRRRLIFEHHTKEVPEVLGSDLSPVIKYFQLIFEWILPPLTSIVSRTNISVSADIANYQAKRFLFSKHCLTFPNGVDSSISKRGSIKELIVEFNVIFSASIFRPWHGLDVFLTALSEYHGDIVVNVYLAGVIPETFVNQLSQLEGRSNLNLVLLGRISKKELFDYYDICHIGIDSLNLKSIGISSGSTLKSKELIARGVPTIFNCIDAGLTWADSLRLNVEGGLTISGAIEWYESLHTSDFSFIYSQVEENISWSALARQLETELLEIENES